MLNVDLLADAIDEQSNVDFRHLDRLYDRFLEAEAKGMNSKAKELYQQITSLEREMGLR